ncbi:MAG: ABC transporter permease [Nitrososphaeria archaeon]
MKLSSRAKAVSQSFFAIIIGLLIGSFLMIIFGFNPINAYYALFVGAFGTVTDVLETLAFAVPLMLTGLTFAVGVRAGLFNIGSEGQMYLGALAAVVIGGTLDLPFGLGVVCATLAGAFVSLLWSLTPAILKVTRGVHEVISTIMFNWIAFWLTTYLIVYHFGDPTSAERSIRVLPSSRYLILFEGSTLTTVIFVAVAYCVLVYFILWGTKVGYELRVEGSNPDAGRYAGVKVWKTTLLAFMLGGIASGLAGASQIIGRPPVWSFYATLGNVAGLGFDGLGVALIGRNHPIGVIAASIFFGALIQGSRYMQYNAGVYFELVRAITGIIIIALSVPEAITVLRRWVKK